MKRLTLDETWKLCVDGMWTWVARQWRKNRCLGVAGLKRKWNKKHFPHKKIKHDCFFCEYNKQQGGHCCSRCPARIIDDKLGIFWCEEGAYGGTGHCWCIRPIGFYNKLRSLKRKRLAKRKK